MGNGRFRSTHQWNSATISAKIGLMKQTFLLAGLLALMPSVSLAMNWEGHDDWMLDNPAAIELQAAQPETPEPLDSYRDCREAAIDNPYEQIPLTVRKCRSVPTAIGD